ncbi:MAG: GNAT family N-acetyltransferase [Sphingomonadales bacterium]|nr:GNAT family N-acetyltransferase [Sphingomonadales bacterium]MDE2569503.1 GNAT family N-acetyltransferase [Sphingomonadales bacterium]
MIAYRIEEDDLTREVVRALVALHLDAMHEHSPPESIHALPVEHLRAPGVSFYTAWDGETLAAMGALKQLDPRHGELKSMRASPAYRGKGAGRAMLRHLIAEARARGYARVSLETGSGEAFEPALGLYASEGFVECGPFADYRAGDPFSRFLTLDIGTKEKRRSGRY